MRGRELGVLLGYSTAIILVYSSYGLIQEYLYQVNEFHHSVFLTLLQSLTYFIFSSIELLIFSESTEKYVPPWEYYGVACAIIVASCFANISLIYLDYPTHVMFKSAKLLPVMAGGIVLLGKSYHPLEYISAIMVVGGLVGFASMDLMNPQFSLFGIIAVGLSLLGDAFHGNMQERLIRSYGISLPQLVKRTSAIGTLLLFSFALVIGELQEAIKFCAHKPTIIVSILVFVINSYIGMRLVLNLVERYDSVVATFVTSTRKVITITLSVIIFPKPFGIFHIASAAIVFLGLGISVYSQSKKTKSPPANKVNYVRCIADDAQSCVV